jgi:hypothetical protein
MPPKYNKEEFIRRAQEKHKKKDGTPLYNYDEFDYKNSRTKGKIICLIHGEFYQIPDKHINRGDGCRKCGTISMANDHRKSLSQFIKEAQEKHKKEDGTPIYRYDKFVYINSDTKGIITCFKHGDFTQIAYDHLSGHGCFDCAIEKNSEKNRKPLKQFIEEAQKIHKKKDGTPIYDYSEFDYINNQTKGKIICNIHGEFKQKPSSHLSNEGCYTCGIIKRSKTHIKPFEDFIKIAIEVHKEKENGTPIYDYSEAIYIDRLTEIRIICTKHGAFEQLPKTHLRGHGCSKCCSNSYSKACISFLNKIPYNILHFENEGEKLLRVKNKKYKADGYFKGQNKEEICELFKHFKGCFKFRNNKSLEVVIEFHGCFWHGCEECFPDRDALNKKINKTYKDLYNYTMKRRLNIINTGYNYIEIWEHQTKEFY